MAFQVIHQQDLMDCGAACLSMICKHYGKDVSLADVRNRTQLGKQGVSILGISEAAESYGFRTLAVQVSYQQLTQETSLPCILHWSQEHFVVFTKVKRKSFFNRKEKLEIADPSHDLVSIDEETFKRHWYSSRHNQEDVGIALLLEPTQSFNKKEKVNAAPAGLGLQSIFKYLLTYKQLLGQLILSLVLASFFQLLLPFLTKSVVDTGIQTRDLHFVYVILLAQLALFGGKITLDFIRSWILLYISTRINISILTDFLIKLMKLPVSYFDTKQTGDILQRMSDHSRIESFLTGSSLNVLFSTVSLILSSGILAFYNGTLFFVFLVFSLCYLVWLVIFLDKRKQLDYTKFGVSASEQGAKIQMIQGMQEIKLQDCGRQVRWNWERLQAKLFRLQVKSLTLEQWQQSGALFINEGKNIVITFFCAKAVIEGEMTLGTMLAIQYIIGQLNGPIDQLIGFIQSWQDAKISMERLNEIHHLQDEEPVDKYFLNTIPTIFTRQLKGGKDPGNDHTKVARNDFVKHHLADKGIESLSDNQFPSISFKKVTFTYSGSGNEPVLKNINLTIPAGKTTAIVGVSGSGKTTLLKLLLKFYEPQMGEIFLDDTSLNRISHQTWRKHCGVVMQDSYIFSDTIACNIAVGEKSADMDRLQYAVEVANISNFIEDLPLKFNTKIGSEGTGISMGQRQRILIARAVYKNPEYIFLDEATNSLDANNEGAIIENLHKFFKGKTVVVVAHRLSTVKHADQIILLEYGIIAERGTHQQLVNLKGKYYTLVKNQLDLGK